MGALQSTLSPEQVALGGGVAVTVAIGALFYTANPPPAQTTTETASTKKKAKKHKNKGQPSSEVTQPTSSSPEDDKALPGSLSGSLTENRPSPTTTLEAPDTTSQSKTKKKKKSKAPSSVPPSSDNGIDDSLLRDSTLLDSSWTRVPSKKTQGKRPVDMSLAEASSDAGANTSVTEEDAASSVPDAPPTPQTLAERLLPKPPKTAVDDMMEKSDLPELSRVMRVTAPVSETPAGISWRDYEDATDLQHTEDDDDDGWGIVKTRKPRSAHTIGSEPTASGTLSSSTEALTKQQRRNAAKRDANKAAKSAAEEDRLARLSRHKKELEKIKIEEQYKKSQGPAKNSLSGGMSSSVHNGQLVWE